jgi:hypothetical protein
MAILLTVLLAFFSLAHADVTRKHHSTSQFMGASEVTSVDYYTSDRSAQTSTTQWTRGMMKTMTKGKPVESTTITRLDKELVWTVDPKEKKYSEQTFADFRKQLEEGRAAMKDEEEQEAPDTTAEDLYQWTVEDKSDTSAKTINGWSCRNVHVVATGVNKENAEDKVWLTLDTWNSPDVPGAEEIRAFNERYMKALGFDVQAFASGLSQAAFLYQNQMAALVEAGQKAPGEPVTSLLEIKRHQLKGPNVGKELKEVAMESVTGKLPFGMKKKKAEPSAPEYTDKVKFSIQTELTEASAGTIDPGTFEVPSGYQLKK